MDCLSSPRKGYLYYSITMSCRKDLITISYHSDDDTWMYQIWELDTWYNGVLESYIEEHGKEELLQELDYIKHKIINL